MKRTNPRRRQQKAAAALGAVLVTAGCAATPAVVERNNPYDGGVTQLLHYCGRLQDTGELATAASVCERAHTLAPGDPRPLFKLGEILSAMNRLPQAASAYRAVLERSPNHAEAHYRLGKTYLAMGEHDLALQELRIAQAQSPNNARIYNALGIANGMLGNQAGARQSFEDGLRVAPDDLSLRNNLGLALVLDGHHAEGIALLQSVSPDPAANPTGYRNLLLAQDLAQNAESGATAVAAAPAPAQFANNEPVSEISTMAQPDLPPPPPLGATDAQTPLLLTEALTPLSHGMQLATAGTPVFPEGHFADDGLDEATESADEPAPTHEPIPSVASEIREGAIDEAQLEPVGLPMSVLSTATMPPPMLTGSPETAPQDDSMPTGTLQRFIIADANPATPPALASADQQVASLNGADMYAVQLASYRSPNRAQDGWQQIRASASDLLTNIDPVVQRADLGPEKGIFYRLRTKPRSKDAATALCAALRARGISCFAVKEDPIAVEDSALPGAAKS